MGTLVALIAGFAAISPHAAKLIITAGGYYYMLGLFALFGWLGLRVAGPRRAVWLGWIRRPGWPGALILLATAFALWSDPFKHKVLFDEYVLQGTALHMHATKEIGTVIRAYDIAGSWVPIDTFLDKRPYFFTFLVSLVHDLTGYRIANMFLVNAARADLPTALRYARERVEDRPILKIATIDPQLTQGNARVTGHRAKHVSRLQRYGFKSTSCNVGGDRAPSHAYQ